MLIKIGKLIFVGFVALVAAGCCSLGPVDQLVKDDDGKVRVVTTNKPVGMFCGPGAFAGASVYGPSGYVSVYGGGYGYQDPAGNWATGVNAAAVSSAWATNQAAQNALRGMTSATRGW